jgi:type IV pilus assembly protein PilN
MKLTINLASRPFVELRPLFARLRLAMVGLAALAVALGVGLHLLNVHAAAAEARMSVLRARTAAYENERHSNEARIRQPQNMAVLERSQLLNALFARKSFSWTAVMMDLEDVLPSGVQVTSIEPQIAKDGEVQIRLRVSGERDRAVQLVRNLEGSRRFLSPRLSNESAQTADSGGGGLAGGPRGVAMVQQTAASAPPGVEFDILSGYNPLPAAPGKKAAKADTSGAVPAKRTGPPAETAKHDAVRPQRLMPRVLPPKGGVAP